MKDKNKKYDNGKHVSLDLIPIEECELALKEFSNGSPALEKCLREMWMHGLKTYSSNPGNKSTFEIGHIVMEENEDIFCYLSCDFLNDERIRIDIIDGRQEIKFAGTIPEKEGAMLFLTREIQSGRKKYNSSLIQGKIGEPFPTEWIRRLRSYDSNPDSTYWGGKVYIKKK